MLIYDEINFREKKLLERKILYNNKMIDQASLLARVPWFGHLLKTGGEWWG